MSKDSFENLPEHIRYSEKLAVNPAQIQPQNPDKLSAEEVNIKKLLGLNYGDVPIRQAERINTSFYISFLTLISDRAGQYKDSNQRGEYDKKRYMFSDNDYKSQALTALEDAYFARNIGPDAVKKFKRDWGEDSEKFDSMLNQLKPQIEEAKENAIKGAEKWNPKDSLDTMTGIGGIITDITPEQRTRLLLLAGYKPEEIAPMLVKLGAAGTMSFGIGALYETVGMGAAGYAGVNPFLEGIDYFAIMRGELPDPRIFAPVALSYAAYYSAMLVSAESNLRLLKNKSINTCPAITGAISYYLLDKLLPEDETIKSWNKSLSEYESSNPFMQDGARLASKVIKTREQVRDTFTRVGILAMEPAKELGWMMTIFVPGVGTSMIVAANGAGAVLNLAQAGIQEGINIYTKMKSKNKKQDS